MSKKQFKPQNKNQIDKNRNEKTEKKTLNVMPDIELLFSFKYFDKNNEIGQDFMDWENESSYKKGIEQIKILIEKCNNALQNEQFQDENEKIFLKNLHYEELFAEITKIENIKNNTKNQSLLCDFLDKLVELSKITKTEAIGKKDKTNPLGIYSNFDFETQSEFKKPNFEIPENAQWATIKRIGGQKSRVAGFIQDNIFYVVFLDKNHKFYVVEKNE
jgi:hypothetical protein